MTINRAKGYSLVEIMIVILLLSITAAIVVPYASGITESQAQAAARIIASDLEYAAQQAIASCQEVTVKFDRNAKTYSLSYQSGLLIHPITKNEYVVDLGEGHGFKEVRIISAFSTDSIVFDPVGTVDPGGKVVLRAGSQEYWVEVDQATGTVFTSSQ